MCYRDIDIRFTVEFRGEIFTRRFGVENPLDNTTKNLLKFERLGGRPTIRVTLHSEKLTEQRQDYLKKSAMVMPFDNNASCSAPSDGD